MSQFRLANSGINLLIFLRRWVYASLHAGQSNFILLNLAIGGDFPGHPHGTTPFPSEMMVDYVRLYTN